VAALLKAMGAAVRSASSVHISGTIQQGSKTVGANFGMTRSGEFSGQVSENGAVLTMLATHGHTYLKLTPDFLRVAQLPASTCSRVCGKYVAYPAAQAQQLFGHQSMASLTHSLADTSPRGVKLLGAVSIAGQLAWLLQDSAESSLYIAAHGKPYVLRAVGPPPGDETLSLTQWNAVRIPGLPPASKVVPLSQLVRSYGWPDSWFWL
jgi:hypothetical protein